MHNSFHVIEEKIEIRFFITLVVLLAVIVGISIYFGGVRRGDNSSLSEVAQSSFPEVSVQADAVYIYDIRSGEVLFSKNEDKRMPLASLTKVMSALVAYESSTPNRVIYISEAALNNEGDSGLYRDEKWRITDLIDFSLISSSNDGMRAMALSLGALDNSQASVEDMINDFVRQMNAKASELGLKNTYFWNETGLDESEVKGGAYGTARDMSMLLEYALKNYPELFEATREVSTTIYSIDNLEHEAKNTNAIVSEIPGILMSKTGFTDTAGGNLSIVFDPEIGRPISISVLGSTEKGRFVDMRKLISATMQYISQ